MKKLIIIFIIILTAVFIVFHTHFYRINRLNKVIPILEQYQVDGFYRNVWGEQDEGGIFHLHGSCNRIDFTDGNEFDSDSCFLDGSGNFDAHTQMVFNKIKRALWGTNVKSIYYIRRDVNDANKITSATFNLWGNIFSSGYPTYVYNMPKKGPPGGQPVIEKKVIDENWTFIIFD